MIILHNFLFRSIYLLTHHFFCLAAEFQKFDLQPTKFSEMSLNDFAKSVADIDTRIEELQRRIEIERRQKEKIVHDIRALVKPSAAVDCDLAATKKHSVSWGYIMDRFGAI